MGAEETDGPNEDLRIRPETLRQRLFRLFWPFFAWPFYFIVYLPAVTFQSWRERRRAKR